MLSIATLLSRVPDWITPAPKAPEPFLFNQCILSRNMAGFLFPGQCSEEERRTIEGRVQDALTRMDNLPPGRYYSLTETDVPSLRFLVERRLAPVEFLLSSGPRGLYISDTQSFVLAVNGADHFSLRLLSGGGKMDDLWKELNQLDNGFGRFIEYAYHERLGYLTTSLTLVGTGLRVMVLLHLPALSMLGEIPRIAQRTKAKRLALRGIMLGEPRVRGMAPQVIDAVDVGLVAQVEPATRQSLYLDAAEFLAVPPENTCGNLYLLVNQDTLGVSEEECICSVEQAALRIVQDEQATRDRILSEERTLLMDRIGRALGVAQSGRLLGMAEALTLASMMRLAAALGLVTGCNCTALNQALLECQFAHLQHIRGIMPDPLRLASERSKLFRALFAGMEMN